MATDKDEASGPAKDSPSAKGTGRDSSTAPPLVAPIFPTVDRTDPLLPDQLRRLQSTVQQYLQAYRTILRVARRPEQEPGLPLILEALRQAEVEYAELITVARHRYDKQRRFRDLTSKLPMTELANIRAADEAEGLLQDAWLVWRNVYATYAQILQALHPSNPAPPAGTIPPDQPEPVPASDAG